MSNILIVDDEKDIRDILSDFLSYQDIVCDTCDSVKAAKVKIQENKYDLIISDIVMPEEKGDELLKWLNTTPEYKTNFIFMTGYSDISREDLLSLGALEIISKPFNFTELSEKIKSHYI